MGKRIPPYSMLKPLMSPLVPLVTHLTDVGLGGIRQHCLNSADTPLPGISSHRCCTEHGTKEHVFLQLEIISLL